MRLKTAGQAFLSALRLAHGMPSRPLGARPNPPPPYHFVDLRVGLERAEG